MPIRYPDSAAGISKYTEDELLCNGSGLTLSSSINVVYHLTIVGLLDRENSFSSSQRDTISSYLVYFPLQ